MSSIADFVKTQQHIARGDRPTLDLVPFLTNDDDDLVARACDALLWHARRSPWPTDLLPSLLEVYRHTGGGRANVRRTIAALVFHAHHHSSSSSSSTDGVGDLPSPDHHPLVALCTRGDGTIDVDAWSTVLSEFEQAWRSSVAFEAGSGQHVVAQGGTWGTMRPFATWMVLGASNGKTVLHRGATMSTVLRVVVVGRGGPNGEEGGGA